MKIPYKLSGCLLVFFTITKLNEAMNWRAMGLNRRIRNPSNTVHDPDLYLPKNVVVEGNQANWIRTRHWHTETKILSCYSAPDNIWKVQNETNDPVKFTIRFQIPGEEETVFQNTIQPRQVIVTGIPGSSVLSLDVDSWGQVV
jgi:hypothetical protein